MMHFSKATVLQYHKNKLDVKNVEENQNIYTRFGGISGKRYHSNYLKKLDEGVKETHIRRTKRVKSKKEKDPDAPKAPLSGYMLFSIDRRREMKEKKENISEKDKMKIIADEWKDLSEDDKEVYIKRAKKLKDKYNVELKEYQDSKKITSEKSKPPKKIEEPKLKKKEETKPKPKDSPKKDSEASESKEDNVDDDSELNAMIERIKEKSKLEKQKKEEEAKAANAKLKEKIAAKAKKISEKKQI